MRPALKRGLRKSIALSLIKTLISGQFAGVHYRLPDAIDSYSNFPALYFANHTSMWDFAITSWFTYHVFNKDPFTMTAEFSMLPYAEWAGAFSVNNMNSLSVAQSLRYSINLLNESNSHALWIFPQGEILPFHIRPLEFQNGISFIIRNTKNVNVIPVSIYYSFGHHPRLEAYIYFGDPLQVNKTNNNRHLLPILQESLETQLNQMIDDLSILNSQNYETIIVGRRDLRFYIFKLLKKPYPPLKSWGRWYEKYL